MFGKRSKPTQNNNDDFAPADFDDGFADDFSDNANAAASAVVEDAWQQDDTGFAEAENDVKPVAAKKTAPKAKSGGALLPLVVLGVIGAGAAAYFTMPSKPVQNAEPVGQVGTLPMGAEPVVDAEPVMTPAAPEAADAGAVAPEAQIAQDAVASAPDTVVPADEVPLASASEPVDASALVAPAVDELPEMPDATPSAVSAEPVAAEPAPAPAPQAEPTSVVESAVAPAEPVASVAPAEPISSASAPVSTSVPTADMSPVAQAPVSAAVPAQTITSSEVSDMQARLAVLERQVGDLAKAVDKLALAQPDLSKAVASLSKSVDGLSKDVKARAVAPAVKSVETSAPVAPVGNTVSETAIQVESKPVESKPAPAAKPTAVAKTTWVLRAAQDGMAWVSPTADGELQRVTVGQTLPGIGKIKSIEVVDGSWQVVGSQGRIRQ